MGAWSRWQRVRRATTGPGAGTLLTLLIAWAAAWGLPPALRAEGPAVTRVAAVGFTVSDLDRAVGFFRDVLTFEPVSEREIAGRPYELLAGVFGLRARVATLALGDERLELTEYLAPSGRPIPPDVRSHDHAFQHVAIVVSDMDAAYAALRARRVRHGSSGPQTLPASIPAAAGIRAFYFRDPDGHFLEVLQFPHDKGDAKWRRRDRLFLGIDHTAIVVTDTEASLRFYRDALGMGVAGESENAGDEQEHLNNVFGARLRITTLRASEGPGIELLEYLAPSDGRPAPADLRATDLLHWQTTLVSGRVGAAVDEAARAGGRLVSPGAVDLPDGALGFRQGALVRDPDGHAMRIVVGGSATRVRATQ